MFWEQVWSQFCNGVAATMGVIIALSAMSLLTGGYMWLFDGDKNVVEGQENICAAIEQSNTTLTEIASHLKILAVTAQLNEERRQAAENNHSSTTGPR